MNGSHQDSAKTFDNLITQTKFKMASILLRSTTTYVKFPMVNNHGVTDKKNHVVH